MSRILFFLRVLFAFIGGLVVLEKTASYEAVDRVLTRLRMPDIFTATLDRDKETPAAVLGYR